MKTLLFAISFAALSAGMSGVGYAQYRYSACANSNSRACINARNAFARHHGGVYPERYYNHWYQGDQGRWSRVNNDWRWERMDGDEYWRGAHGWEWKHHRHHHDDD